MDNDLIRLIIRCFWKSIFLLIHYLLGQYRSQRNQKHTVLFDPKLNAEFRNVLISLIGAASRQHATSEIYGFFRKFGFFYLQLSKPLHKRRTSKAELSWLSIAECEKWTRLIFFRHNFNSLVFMSCNFLPILDSFRGFLTTHTQFWCLTSNKLISERLAHVAKLIKSQFSKSKQTLLCRDAATDRNHGEMEFSTNLSFFLLSALS